MQVTANSNVLQSFVLLCSLLVGLLMDEPFSHLDQDNISRAAALIEEECSKERRASVNRP